MIDAAIKGAWSDLEAKLRPFVASRVRVPMDVDDVVQDIFLKMHKSLPSLQDDQRFGPWVYRVARSTISDHHRTSSRHSLSLGDGEEETTLDGEDEEEGAVERELAQYTVPFVEMLPSPYREALTLIELQGLSQKEAAARLGISLSAMKSRVQRGRHHLRGLLEACCDIAVDARGRVMSCDPRPDGRIPGVCCP